MAAALQNLDLDVFYELWAPPAHFIDKTRLKGLPQHGIGRGCKVGKEEIVGLLTALRLFVEEDAPTRRARWRGLMQELADGLAGLPHAEVRLLDEGEVPQVALDLDEAAARPERARADEAPRARHARGLRRPVRGRPRAASCSARMSLKDGEPAQIAERVRAAARPARTERRAVG